METQIRKLYIVISLLFVIFSMLLYETHPLIQREFKEDRLIENISAGAFLITFLFSLSFLILHKIVRYKKTLILIMTLGLVGFLDEISFGERIFGLIMPSVWGIKLDAVHDVFEIALVSAKKYEYIFISFIFLIAIASIYILINKRITLNAVINSILLETPYSFLAFFVFYLSIAIIIDISHGIHHSYRILEALEEILEMNAALALLFCCLSIRYTLKWLLGGLALIAGAALGTISAPDHGATWQTYIAAGEKAFRQADYPQADKHFTAALTEAKEFEPRDLRLPTTLNNLTAVYYAQGRNSEAEPLFERSLAIREHALGPEHPVVALSFNNLATLYQAQGRYAEAEPLLKRALAIREKALGPQHPYVAQSLNNLAGLYHDQGKYDPAELLYQRSLAIIEKVLGPEHPLLVQLLENYADLLRKTGRDTEATEMEVRAKAIRAKHARDN